MFEVRVEVHAIVVVRVRCSVCLVVFLPCRQAERVAFRVYSEVEVEVKFSKGGQGRERGAEGKILLKVNFEAVTVHNICMLVCFRYDPMDHIFGTFHFSVEVGEK